MEGSRVTVGCDVASSTGASTCNAWLAPGRIVAFNPRARRACGCSSKDVSHRALAPERRATVVRNECRSKKGRQELVSAADYPQVQPRVDNTRAA